MPVIYTYNFSTSCNVDGSPNNNVNDGVVLVDNDIGGIEFSGPIIPLYAYNDNCNANDCNNGYGLNEIIITITYKDTSTITRSVADFDYRCIAPNSTIIDFPKDPPSRSPSNPKYSNLSWIYYKDSGDVLSVYADYSSNLQSLFRDMYISKTEVPFIYVYATGLKISGTSANIPITPMWRHLSLENNNKISFIGSLYDNKPGMPCLIFTDGSLIDYIEIYVPTQQENAVCNNTTIFPLTTPQGIRFWSARNFCLSGNVIPSNEQWFWFDWTSIDDVSRVI